MMKYFFHAVLNDYGILRFSDYLNYMRLGLAFFTADYFFPGKHQTIIQI